MIVLLAIFSTDLLDAAIVNVAILSIQSNLYAPCGAIQWMIAGYVLAFSLLLVTCGRLGVVYGRKHMLRQ